MNRSVVIFIIPSAAAFVLAFTIIYSRSHSVPANPVEAPKPTVVKTLTYYNPKQDRLTTPLSTPAPLANYNAPISEGEANDIDEEPPPIPLPPIQPRREARPEPKIEPRTERSNVCARHNMRKVWVNSRSWRCRR
jgi:hypothetical protein